MLHIEYLPVNLAAPPPLMAPLAFSPPPTAEPIGTGQLTPIVDKALSGLSQSAGSGVPNALAGLDFEVVGRDHSKSWMDAALPLGTRRSLGDPSEILPEGRLEAELPALPVDRFYELLGA